jgi:hypothetical protein
MKRVILVFAVFVAFASCKKEESPNPVSADFESISSFLTIPGGLKIIEFIEDQTNKNSLFSDYNFVFLSNGIVSATSDDFEIIGSYSLFTDDGKVELWMDFPASGKFRELTDDWYFILRDDRTIKFEDNRDVIQFQIH